MDYITTTELRSKSARLITTLKKGGIISLIHRSKIVGVIQPAKEEPKPLTKQAIRHIQKLAKELNLPKTSYEERKKIYSEHLMEKYGKDIS